MHNLARFLVQHKRFLGFGLMLTFASSFGQSFFIALSAGMIREEFSLGHADFGMMYSLATLLSAFVLLWSGKQIDRYAVRPVSMVVWTGFAGACFLMSSIDHPALLLVAIFLLRHLGQGLMGHTATTAVIRTYEHQRGRALSLVSLGFPLGEALLPTIGIYLITTVGWRASWSYAGFALVLLMPLLWCLAKQEKSFSVDNVARKEGREVLGCKKKVSGELRSWTRSEVLRDRRLYLILPTLLVSPFILTGFLIHQVHIAGEQGWPLTTLASSFVAFAGSQILAAFVTGMIADRYGSMKLLRWILLPQGVALLALVAPLSTSGVWLFMGLSGIAYGMSATLASMFLPEIYGTGNLGSLKALVEAAMICATAASPVLFGWFFDAGLTVSTLAWLGLMSLTMAQIALMKIGRTNRFHEADMTEKPS